jgi:septal ring factor EnvC (AmiA/AmiB activator)
MTVLLVIAASTPLTAQRRQIDRQLRDNRERLEDIREERRELERELEDLRNRARDVRSELGLIDQQRTATSRLVNELDRQMAGLTTQLDTITFELILAEDAFAEKQAILERRISEIYKRGRLWAFEVLLAAESFGNLVSRYKYLFLVSRQDRELTQDIQTLRDRIARQRSDLLSVRTVVSTQRAERDQELQRFVRLEQERQRTLASMRRSEERTTTRLDSLARDELRVVEVVATLERSRRAAVARGEVSEATITAADQGDLTWPLEGEIIYRFGANEFRDGTRVPRGGIGIRAPVGTPVHAVRGGIVRSAGTNMGTWGPTVIIEHGGGYYTLYLHLSSIAVAQDQRVEEGHVLGASGGEGSDEGPHLEFQIRQSPPNAATPITLDPLNWLRNR